MRKLQCPVEPEDYAAACAAFVQAYPPAVKGRTESQRWENFKDEQREVYKLVKSTLYANQSGLCAFCECKLIENKREIEHFIPKCLSTATCDHTVDFSNFTMGCKGKIRVDEDDHCGHLKGNADPTSLILSPYILPDFPLVKYVVLDKKLSFEPDEVACEKAGISPALVDSTIERLGLNCSHLLATRWEVWDALEEELSAESLDELRLTHLTPVNGELKPFFTTRFLTLS